MRFLFTALLALALSAAASPAQTPTGTLRGTVLDQTGAVIARAQLELRQPDTSVTRTTVSDSLGAFIFPSLTPGTWQLRITSPGFAPASQSVAIAVASVQNLSLTLKVGSEKVIDELDEPFPHNLATQQMDHDTPVHQSIVTAQDLASLPLPARSFANIAYLAPGTEPVEPSDPTKARITAVSTGGSSGLNNELSVDGGDNSDDFIGGFLQNFSPDAIDEFAIRTAQEDADTGGTTAASIVITTKSGTNALHGSAAFYERAAQLNARYPIENPAPNPKQPFSRQNYVATLGGPAIRERLWYFASFEGIRENASIAYSPASLTQFNALAQLASEGLIPGVSSIPIPSVVAIPFRDFFDSVRFDWALSDRSHWMLRTSTDSYTTHNSLVQQATLPSTGLLTHNNYFSAVLSNTYTFTPHILGTLVLNGSALHLTQSRNANLGFALAFPFSSTALTVSGFETFGDNQFATPITFFPSERNQQKYQLRYDLDITQGRHSIRTGINLIHEPVLGGAFPGNSETLYQLPENPTFYAGNPAQFSADLAANSTSTTLGGGFSQNVQRLAAYAQDSWHLSPALTLSYGFRYSATYGLLTGSGRSQAQNPGVLTLQALNIPLVSRPAADDRHQLAPRIGFAWSPGHNASTVLRGGFGIYLNDLAQNGWATALQAVNTAPGPCHDPIANPTGAENSGCISGSASGGTAGIIDSGYRTPYAIHITGGIQHAFSSRWLLSADYTHQQGNHGYRAYSYTGGTNLFTPQLALTDPNQPTYVPNVNLFRSDNRSSYNALMLHLQGETGRLSLVANYTFSKAQTWGCVLGELFDYVNGVCDPLNAFAPGDYGPSGEDVRHRAVFAAQIHFPAGFLLSGISQAESARPFTVTTADNSQRISVNGQPTPLDAFRGTPYIQTDLRINRPIHIRESLILEPFAEFFNLFNRNNPGANYITNVAALPVPPAQAQAGNVTSLCTNTDCSSTTPITSLRQLAIPGGALGDFFGPGTTVGAPFATQLGLRLTF